MLKKLLERWCSVIIQILENEVRMQKQIKDNYKTKYEKLKLEKDILLNAISIMMDCLNDNKNNYFTGYKDALRSVKGFLNSDD